MRLATHELSDGPRTGHGKRNTCTRSSCCEIMAQEMRLRLVKTHLDLGRHEVNETTLCFVEGRSTALQCGQAREWRRASVNPEEALLSPQQNV
jgi:hypothetical protein